MNVRNGPVARAAEWAHHYFLGLLIAAYAIAAVAPAAGLWVRQVSFGEVAVLGRGASVSLPSVMLALLLFNAGLGVQPDRLRRLLRNPLVLIAGLAGNLLVPLLFILGMSLSLNAWHNPAEVQCILVGLALIASMPVAGSSTAWSQNSNGDLGLSLGLVVLSTCLSPLTTPAVLEAVGWVASGEYADALRNLAAGGTSSFLLAFVMLPSLAGILARCVLGETVLGRARPMLKLTNSANLLVLCYSNAAVALPGVVANPDWDFMGVMLVIVLGLCALGFTSGWVVARGLRADEGQRTSLMFGLGMTNNGTGLVLAGTALGHLPDVMLPVIFYNLVQHVVAAVTDRLMNPSAGNPPVPVTHGSTGAGRTPRRILPTGLGHAASPFTRA
jgi:BASS family bile acid:Na+ symporter